MILFFLLMNFTSEANAFLGPSKNVVSYRANNAVGYRSNTGGANNAVRNPSNTGGANNAVRNPSTTLTPFPSNKKQLPLLKPSSQKGQALKDTKNNSPSLRKDDAKDNLVSLRENADYLVQSIERVLQDPLEMKFKWTNDDNFKKIKRKNSQQQQQKNLDKKLSEKDISEMIKSNFVEKILNIFGAPNVHYYETLNIAFNPLDMNTSNETLNNVFNLFDMNTSNNNTKEITKFDGNVKKIFPLVLNSLKDLMNKAKLFKFDNIYNNFFDILPPKLPESKWKKHIEKVYTEFKRVIEKGLIKYGELHGGNPEMIIATEIINNGGKEIVETLRDMGENIKNNITMVRGDITKKLENVWENDIIPFISTAFDEFSRRIIILEKMFQQSSKKGQQWLKKGKQSWKNDALNHIKNFFVDFGNVLHVVGKYLLEIIYSLLSLSQQIMYINGIVNWSLGISFLSDWYFKWGICARVLRFLWDKLCEKGSKVIKLPECMNETPKMIYDDFAFFL